MAWREAGWKCVLAGLPFAYFLLLITPPWSKPETINFDFWHAQAVWGMTGVLLLWATSYVHSVRPILPNAPLMAWVLWTAGSALWVWTRVIVELKRYPAERLVPIMNLLVVVWFYQAATTQWTRPMLQRLIRWVAVAGVVVTGYSYFQIANMDQFFSQFPQVQPAPDLLTGTIGNPNHLAVYLAMILPFVLLQRGWRWVVGAWAIIGCLLLTRSAAGILSLFAALTWWAWHGHRRWFWGLLALGLAGGLWVWFDTSVLNMSGRLEAWQEYWRIFAHKPITGTGPGFVMLFSKQIVDGPLQSWRHCHNEYLQLLVEQGAIAFGILLWAITVFWGHCRRLLTDSLAVALMSSLLAFGVNALFNFPAHLWLTSSLALMAYCGVYVLAHEQTGAV